MRAFILGCLLFITSLASAQSKITYVEYWFDGDYLDKVSTNISPIEEYYFSDQINTASLSDGLHTFHIRFKNDSGYYSTEITRFIFKNINYPPAAQNISTYEYWFDSDYANRIEMNVTDMDVFVLDKKFTAATLTEGLHTFHIRFKDVNGYYSNEITRFIFKNITYQPGSAKMVQYDYWFDGDYVNRIEKIMTATDIFMLDEELSTDNLTEGLHTFHIRFKDENGYFSQEITRFIFKNIEYQADAQQIDKYEYWLDGDYGKRVVKNITNTDLFELDKKFASDSLSEGLHTFHIRFKDKNGYYSNEVTRFIYKSGITPSGADIVAYRYWVDEDMANITTINLSSPITLFSTLIELDISYSDTGFHDFNIQFLDAKGYWSATYSSILYNAKDPAISQIVPAQGKQNEIVPCIIFGNGFVPGTSFKFVRAGVDTIFFSESNIVIDNYSKVNITVDLEGKSVGFYDVALSIPGADTSIVLSNAFNVTYGNDATLDQDGLETLAELTFYGTDPNNFDTNGDWVADGINVFTGKNPLSNDTDGDGVLNGIEITRGTSTLVKDTDSDGVNDKLDAFPLDPNRSSIPPPVPSDVTPPIIQLIEPQ